MLDELLAELELLAVLELLADSELELLELELLFKL